MKRKLKKLCFVPQCRNTSRSTPDKVFLSVPSNMEVKKAWFKAVRRDAEVIPTTKLHCCEDHFNMQEDMENYMYYKMMGVRLLMKKSCIPHIFNNRSDRKRATAKPTRPGLRKRNRKSPDEAADEDADTYGKNTVDVAVQIKSKQSSARTADKKCDARPHYRSKYIQCDLDQKTVKSSNSKGTTASPTFNETNGTREESPSTSKSDGQNNFLVDEDLIHTDRDFVTKNHKICLGIPNKWCCWLLRCMPRNCGDMRTFDNVLLTLSKIKLNDSFERIGERFGMSARDASKTFGRTLPVLTNFLKILIYWPPGDSIEEPFPPGHVQSIIGFLEIEIQKPTNPESQALTWSECKKCNTIKYLLSTTPDGFISFVSSGYGGRISDTLIFEECGFLDAVPAGTGVVVDRRFKDAKVLLERKNCELVRFSAVSEATKLTEEETLPSERIDSVHVHVEGITGRLREFNVLKSHSVIHQDMLRHIDDVVTVACALSNLQSGLIELT